MMWETDWMPYIQQYSVLHLFKELHQSICATINTRDTLLSNHHITISKILIIYLEKEQITI